MDRVRAARSVTQRSQGADPIPGPRTFDSAPVLGTPQAASVPGANDFAPVTGTPDAARALLDHLLPRLDDVGIAADTIVAGYWPIVTETARIDHVIAMTRPARSGFTSEL